MIKKALDANEFLCDNNTVKTHHVNQSDFLKKKKLGFLDKILSKKQFFLFPTKFVRMLRRIKQGEYRQCDQKSFRHEQDYNSFTSRAFLVIGVVHLALFALTSL